MLPRSFVTDLGTFVKKSRKYLVGTIVCHIFTEIKNRKNMKAIVTILWYAFFFGLGNLVGEAMWGTRGGVKTASIILAITGFAVIIANVIHLTSRRHA